MKKIRKIIEIDEELCNGCGQCVPDCAEGSLQIIDGKARLVSENLCDGLGACLGSCPTGALKIVEREAEEFDEKAVEEFLKKKKARTMTACPSSKVMSIGTTPCQAANQPVSHKEGALSHWPVQIRLLPPSAPFLKDSDLLITADCTAVAYPALQDMVKGRVVMMGCPKFDDQQLYVEKFTELFRQCPLNSVTILIMEVPCCSSMLGIIKKARENAGADFNARYLVISPKGMIIKEDTI